MYLRKVGNPKHDIHSDLQVLVTGFTNLEQVCRWAYEQTPALEIQVVTQDEFTHDVVISLHCQGILVFDTT